MSRLLRDHKRAVAGAGAALAVAVAVVLVWFQPHKLVVDDKVNEATPPTAAVETPADTELSNAAFVSQEHKTSGRALVLVTGGGRHLRLEHLNTSNGPDLRVYLSTAAPDAKWSTFDDDYIELGKLKGNIGSQNYEIPGGTDLTRFKSAVIWCKRFSVPFGAAALAAQSGE
jgi:uncharacterized protein with LGFP repeats